MTNKYDVIIIGSGLAGLTAGALLTKRGKKVLVLEQYTRVGGYATAWNRKGIIIEGVLHEIDDIGPDSEKADILKYLNIYNKLEFIKLNEFYRIVTEGIDETIPHGVQNYIDFLTNKFPDEKINILNYIAAIKGVYHDIKKLSSLKGIGYLKLLLFPYFFKNIYKLSRISTGEFIDQCFNNDKLKTIISANIGYYSDNPYELGFTLFAIAQYSYIYGGGWYIKGGSQKFSDAFADKIKECNGEVITNAEVFQIITSKNKAVGVKYKHKNDEHTVYADYILNNASPIWALSALDNPNAVSEIVKNTFVNGKTGTSSFGIYIITKGKNAPQGRPYSTFVFPYDTPIENLKSGQKDYSKKTFSIVDYGAIDNGLSSTDTRLISVFTSEKYSEWSSLSKEEYIAKKETVTNILLNNVKKIYPDIVEGLISCESATPLTMERYTKNTNGAIYGYAQTLNQSGMKRFKFSKIMKNLLNVSAWGSVGGGYSGAIYTGYMTANKIK